MAERTIKVDDIDGTVESSTTPIGRVVIAVDDKAYALDLSEANRKRLDAVLEPFLEAGTRLVGGRPGRAPGYRSRESRERAKKVREWAVENGHEIAEHGRIPREVLEGYAAAHGEPLR